MHVSAVMQYLFYAFVYYKLKLNKERLKVIADSLFGINN